METGDLCFASVETQKMGGFGWEPVKQICFQYTWNFIYISMAIRSLVSVQDPVTSFEHIPVQPPWHKVWSLALKGVCTLHRQHLDSTIQYF